MNKERKHIVFLARWYPHRYDPMFGLFVQRHAEAAALFNNITVVYCQQTTDNGQQTIVSMILEYWIYVVSRISCRGARTCVLKSENLNCGQSLLSVNLKYN